MRVDVPDSWPTTADEAVALQNQLRDCVRSHNPKNGGAPQFSKVAGIDSAYADDGTVATAAVILDAETLEVTESAVAHGVSHFPYVPGLLAFRELPATVAALAKLSGEPDLLVCDAQGRAHPRRFGLACHVGLLTQVPTIGVAKSVWGDYRDPGRARGDMSDVTIDGEVVGRAVRTRDDVKPLFVSVGHLIDLDTACEWVLKLTAGFRQPETTRQADRRCRAALREATKAASA
ncbi:endonuclease V [Nocardia camponoti]|uniref:Endonuclease V n=1 Tax=Nocardia camponoti TaxID=1616106 RepID=A0A917V6W5_9NOCA|nr:endonuclease V [Nocardia camponoti]GGK45974.1 endonuclease V [Nocardia camponoti]